jgi:tetratricopeptide (TPR) repeat protein
MAIRQSAPSADLLFARGVSYMALHNYAEAQADLESALRLRPNFTNAQEKLRETRQALGVGNGSAGGGQSMYDNFKDILGRSRISFAEHPSYTERYVTARGHLFCNLMADGNLTKLTQEIVFPPVQSMTETVRDRSRVETAILMSGTPAYCPNNQQTANDWIRTNMR